MILEGFKKINEEQITRVENTLNISFPLDYKDFILSNNGMCAEGELGITLPLNQEVIAIDILYGIDTETENCNILEWTQEYKEDLPENTLIIGDAGIGNTWHHHQDGKTLQAVDRAMHRQFTHRGGISIMKGNK